MFFSGRKSLSTNERLFVDVMFLVFFLNAIKPLLDFYLKVPNNIVTILQSFLFLFSAAILIGKRIFELHPLVYIFITYLLLRTFVELLDGEGSLLQPSVLLLRDFIFILGFPLLRLVKLSKISGCILSILLSYLAFTVMVSVVQQTDSSLTTLFSNYGGNITSGNHLGFSRSNGGIGGTVVDYAVFCVYVLLGFVFMTEKSPYRYLALTLILIAAYLCFSRILILIIFLLIFGFIYKSLRRAIFASVILIFLFILYYQDFSTWIELYFEMIGSSDAGRMGSWDEVLDSLSGLNLFIGKSMGLNSGYVAEGFSKITADGHILGTLYDIGLIGLLLYFLCICLQVRRATSSRFSFVSIMVLLLIVFQVNSGAEKIINMITFVLMLMMLKGSHE
jgi:hypothetical protein